MPRYFWISLFFIGLINCTVDEGPAYQSRIDVPDNSTEEEIVQLASRVVPSDRQMWWQKLETTAFIHFGINTFTGQEWGDGTEDPFLFNPTELNANQWVKTISEAGMKMLLITAKHHDGFCLWPSAYTDHSVKSSSWLGGKGDLVRDLAEACQKFKVSFGIYLSPWDRNSQVYGTNKYNDYFRNQLTELLTNYGKIDEVWFDGANGEGPNGQKQIYDWASYFKVIRELQPHAVIAVMGPDVRWVGTESGYGRETEWSVLPIQSQDKDQIANESQTEVHVKPEINAMENDLGSRSKIYQASKLIWYPSEVDVSIRPGWFYHDSQDEAVKSPAKLLDIYFSSVGRNSVLLLNIPPDKRGLIHERDVVVLQEYKRGLEDIFGNDLASQSEIIDQDDLDLTASLTDNDLHTSASLSKSESPSLYMNWDKPLIGNVVLLQEDISKGQQVEKFRIEYLEEGEYKNAYEGTTIGYKRIIRIPKIETSSLRIHFEEFRDIPNIAKFGFYQNLPEVVFTPKATAFVDNITIEMESNFPNSIIHYTFDGSEPTEDSPVYNQPISISGTTQFKVLAIDDSGRKGFVQNSVYNKAKFEVTLENAPHAKYTGGGASILTDGLVGKVDHAGGRWLGFEGSNLVATIDLGEERTIKNLEGSFLQNPNSWIYLPDVVSFSTSINGENFKSYFREKVVSNDEAGVHTVVSPNKMKIARYIRVEATNIGVCPEGSPGEGNASWLFVSEISIR
jgi:alpha-L-fucosidase